VDKDVHRGPQILWLKAGYLAVQENRIWISIVVPKPDEHIVGSTVEPQGAAEISEADMALPTPQVERRRNTPAIVSPRDTPAALEVGDIIVLVGKEELQARDGGICIITNIHVTSLDEELGGRDEEQGTC
jgi:hypothetical protein